MSRQDEIPRRHAACLVPVRTLPGADGTECPSVDPELLSPKDSCLWLLAREHRTPAKLLDHRCYSRFPPILWAGPSVRQLLFLPWRTSAASTPSTPCWRNPTRYRRVKHWPGSPLGCGFCSSASWCSRSYCSLMGACAASTTRERPWKLSRPNCATRQTWTHSAMISSGW